MRIARILHLTAMVVTFALGAVAAHAQAPAAVRTGDNLAAQDVGKLELPGATRTRHLNHREPPRSEDDRPQDCLATAFCHLAMSQTTLASRLKTTSIGGELAVVVNEVGRWWPTGTTQTVMVSSSRR